MRRLRRVLLCSAAAIIIANPAKADPIITPALIAAGLTQTVTIGTAVISLASVASALIVSGATFAIGQILSSLGSSSKPEKINPGTFQVKQALPSLVAGFGECRLAGAKFVYEAPNGVWIDGIVHCVGPINRFVAWFANDLPSIVNPAPPADGYSWGGTNAAPPWLNVVSFEARTGLPEQPAPSGLFGLLGWDENYKLNGLAYTITYAQPVPQKLFAQFYGGSGPPSASVLAETALVYDPRDPTQNINDPSTFKYSANAALCTLFYLFANRGYDHEANEWVPLGFGFPTDEFDLETVKHAADVCDQVIFRADGSPVRRYECHFSYNLGTDERRAVLKKLLASWDGEIFTTVDGKIGLRGGEWTEPTVTLTDEHIVSYRYLGNKARDERFNRLKVTFTDPLNDHQPNEADPFDAFDLQEQEGGTYTGDFDGTACREPTQARRLAKIAVYKQNPDEELAIVTNLFGLNLYGERTLRLKFDELNIDRTFLITDFVENSDGKTCNVQIASLDGVPYQWNAALEDGTRPAPKNNNVSVSPIPSVLNPKQETIRNYIGGQISSLQLRITTDISSNPLFHIIGQIKPYGAGDDQYQDFTKESDTSLISPLLNDATLYVYRLAMEADYSGERGTWSDPIQYLATADPNAPSVPTGLRAVYVSGAAAVDVDAPNSANVAAVRLYRASGLNAGFGMASLRNSFLGGPNQHFNLTENAELGVHNWYSTAVNGSGVASASAGPAIIRAFRPVTNILQSPEDLSSNAWGKVNSASSLSGVAPDGTTCSTLLETSASGEHVAYQVLTTPDASKRWRLSFIAKASGRTKVLSRVTDGSFSGIADLYCDLTSGTIIASGTNGNASNSLFRTSLVGNGFVLIECATVIQSTSAFLGIYILNENGTSSYAGDPTKGIIVSATALSPY